MKIRLLLNLSYLKSGGGQTVALNFVKNAKFYDGYDFIVIVVKNTQLDHVCRSLGYEVVCAPRKGSLRFLWDLSVGSFLIWKKDIKLIYTYFGYGFYLTRVKQIIGAADSNIYFPEIDFWSEQGSLDKFRRKIIDAIRLKTVHIADGIIFENPTMYRRHLQYGIPNQAASLILPSVMHHKGVSDKRFKREGYITLLFACGWQLNKGILVIPEILKRAQEKNLKLQILFTSQLDGSLECARFKEAFKNLKQSLNLVDFIGSQPVENLQSLYSSADFVCLFSKLESFSNNIIESWLHRKVLLVTEANWSRDLCGHAAVYVDRKSPDSIIEAILHFNSYKESYESVLISGDEQLKHYNTIENRTQLELDFLRQIL